MDYPSTGTFNPDPLSSLLAEDMALALEQVTAAAKQAVGGDAGETLSISSGVIVPDSGTVRVDTEASASTDDLDRIQATNMRDGAELVLWAANVARVVTVKSGAGGAGQIITHDGEDYALDSASKCLRLQRYGASWLEVSRTQEAITGQAEQDARLDRLDWFVRQLFGGAESGVIYYSTAGTNSLKCVAMGTPGMTVSVQAGAGFLDGVPFKISVSLSSPSMTAPLSNPRYDAVFLNVSDSEIVIVNGTEAGNPTPPSTAPDGCILVANVYHRVGSTSIKNTDDAVNSYIVDARVAMNG